MNKVKATVLEVLEEPKFNEESGREWWSVKVKTIDISTRPEEEKLIFDTKEEAEKVKEGYEFDH
jgi:TPP-dependent trihydroxycyclohexane-1,2-dione (THcHDO) dehydratase